MFVRNCLGSDSRRDWCQLQQNVRATKKNIVKTNHSTVDDKLTFLKLKIISKKNLNK